MAHTSSHGIICRSKDTKTKTHIQTSCGDSKSFDVKVGVHQGSVLSPLLFIIVMDVISKDIRESFPWELLYADDLVLMAKSEQELIVRMSSWQAALEGKGLKVNVGKSKVMVSSADAGETEKTGEYPCGVCYTGVGANSIRCTKCRSWVHRRCSGICGSLQAASKTFICKRCLGTISQKCTSDNVTGLDLHGTTYDKVDQVLLPGRHSSCDCKNPKCLEKVS